MHYGTDFGWTDSGFAKKIWRVFAFDWLLG
jgi:hypothetical protein